MGCSPPDSSVHGIPPGKNNEVGCHFLLQGIFPTQGLNLCLLHWQADSLPSVLRFYQFLCLWFCFVLVFRLSPFRLAGRACTFTHEGVIASLISHKLFPKRHWVSYAIGETHIVILSCPMTWDTLPHTSTCILRAT